MYRVSFRIDGRRGKIGAFPNSVIINFSEVFTGTPRYALGSSFEIIERLTISTRLYDRKLVDIDSNWFDQKYYLGSFQLIDSSGSYAAKLEDQGYLYALDQTIERRTINTVAFDQPAIQYGTSGSAIDACNFYLEPAIYQFPGEVTPRPGTIVSKPKDSFISRISEGSAPILDKEFDRQIRGVQLFLLPGVEGVVINYEVFPAQTVESDYAPAEVPQCVFINPDCNTEFAAFLQQSPGTKFESEELAIQFASANSILADAVANTYVCSTNPVFIYTYYTLRERPVDCESRAVDFVNERRAAGNYSIALDRGERDTRLQTLIIAQGYPPGTVYDVRTEDLQVPGCPPGTTRQVYTGSYTASTVAGVVIGTGS